MTRTAEDLKAQPARLPISDRADLAEYLIGTLDYEADPDAEAAWDVELTRREAEIKNGAAEGEPAASVFGRLGTQLVSLRGPAGDIGL